MTTQVGDLARFVRPPRPGVGPPKVQVPGGAGAARAVLTPSSIRIAEPMAC
jgi:hypothetical protein